MEVSFAGASSGWLRVETPAKLNLFLEILGKRPDGFHELETLMVAISLCDTLFVSENSEGRIKLSCEWSSGMEARSASRSERALENLPSEADNIVYKAMKRLRDEALTQRGATIRLVKRIPSAAGLGGASSDAAAALWALNKIWQLGWPRERLAELAADIGSDVPFFLPRSRQNVQAATCRGRGERIEWETGLSPLHFVVVKPPAGLSTALVYKHCRVPTTVRDISPLRDALRRGDSARVGKSLHNRLQDAALPLCPWVGYLQGLFDRADVLGHQMSGSGSSYFALCRNAQQARRFANRIRGQHLVRGRQAGDQESSGMELAGVRAGGATAPGIGEVFYATTRPAL